VKLARPGPARRRVTLCNGAIALLRREERLPRWSPALVRAAARKADGGAVLSKRSLQALRTAEALVKSGGVIERIGFDRLLCANRPPGRAGWLRLEELGIPTRPHDRN